jgi:hypothetical protein
MAGMSPLSGVALEKHNILILNLHNKSYSERMEKEKSATYMLLKNEMIILGKGISLGDNSNEINAFTDAS